MREDVAQKRLRDLHERALEHGMVLKDASAYNVQFVGSRPTFIDLAEQVSTSVGRYVIGQGSLALANGILSFLVLTFVLPWYQKSYVPEGKSAFVTDSLSAFGVFTFCP